MAACHAQYQLAHRLFSGVRERRGEGEGGEGGVRGKERREGQDVSKKARFFFP